MDDLVFEILSCNFDTMSVIFPQQKSIYFLTGDVEHVPHREWAVIRKYIS